MLRRHLTGLLAALASPKCYALYEPAPHAVLAHLPGSWRGALTYRDWSKPDRLVTLPCHMHASLLTPTSASLYFVFDDGGGKNVYSYDRWLFNFVDNEMIWASGGARPEETTYRIDAAMTSDTGATVNLSRKEDGKTYRQSLDMSERRINLTKVEIALDGTSTFRNGYQLVRLGA